MMMTCAGPSAGNEDLKKALLDHVIEFFDLAEATDNGTGSCPRSECSPSPSGNQTPSIISQDDADYGVPRKVNRISSNGFSSDRCISSNSVTQRINLYASFFRTVMDRTARLVAEWQCVGFVHGVLNTDNLHIAGLTLDYGPFGFMEHYDKDYVPNGSDNAARYCYSRQPEICLWNLNKLAESLSPLLPQTISSEILDSYYSAYSSHFHRIMRKKFGLTTPKDGDESLVSAFYNVMENAVTDFTDAFVALTEFVEDAVDEAVRRPALLEDAFASTDSAATALEHYLQHHESRSALIQKLLYRSANPEQLMQNMMRKAKIHKLSMHPQQITELWKLLKTDPTQVSGLFMGASMDAIVEEISAQKDILDKLMDISVWMEKLESMDEASKHSADMVLWNAWLDKYIGRLAEEWGGSSTSSSSYVAESTIQSEIVHLQPGLLSSATVPAPASPVTASDSSAQAAVNVQTVLKQMQSTVTLMRSSNPTFVLKNWIAHEIIKDAEEGNYSTVRLVLKLLTDPYNPAYSTFVHEVSRCGSKRPPAQGKHTAATDSAKSTREANGAALADEKKAFLHTPPEWASSLICTCSS